MLSQYLEPIRGVCCVVKSQYKVKRDNSYKNITFIMKVQKLMTVIVKFQQQIVLQVRTKNPSNFK